MLEASIPHTGAAFAGRAVGWPPHSHSPSPRRNHRRRRESKVAYHNGSNISRCSPTSPKNIAGAASNRMPATYSYNHMRSRPVEQMRPRSETEQTFKVENVDYFKQSYNVDFDVGAVVHPETRAASSWQSEMISSYTLAPQAPGSDQYLNNNTSSQNGFSFDISSDMASSWNEIIPTRGNIEVAMNNLPTLDIPLAREARYGSLDSANSVPGCSPKSSGTSNSDGYVFPLMPSGTEPTASTNQLCDFDLFSDEYFHTGQHLDPLAALPACSNSMYQDPFFSSNGLPAPGSDQLDYNNAFTTDGIQWSGAIIGIPRQAYDLQEQPRTTSNTPWSLEELQVPKSQAEKMMDSGTFEPTRSRRLEIKKTRQDIDSGQLTDGQASQGTRSPLVDSESESFTIPFDSNNYTPTHSSPLSQKSSPSHISSPGHNEIAPYQHTHVYSSSYAGVTKPTISRGRQRNLTAVEKRQAREVREAKACWACHISKTKCSPCSPGSPCIQCARLVGKRRFCKFSCFNDPLESLYRFLVPDYLMGHLTRQDVEAFVGRNTKSWGTQSLRVRMAWGYRRHLEAEVVTLELHSDHSEAGFQDTTISDSAARPVLVRKRSPPLGIPLAAMDDMQDTYSRYVQDIVETDLTQYVPVSYFTGDSDLLTRLIRIVSSFYYAGGFETNAESDLLRQALEIHVTCVILEKSLILDRDSTRIIQDHLQQEYPEKPVPRCAQRQIKLALFLEQQTRIHKVLKEWGNMMWMIGKTANNDKKWAVSFCVLLIMVLVIDKISVSAYYFCEGEIQHHGADPKSERAKFMQLISLTENELFERCKEIFHWKFKTRKGGKEACNPIRDGMEAFRGRAVGGGVANLTSSLQALVRDFGIELKSHCSLDRRRQPQASVSPYTDAGRLTCIFLADFLDP